MVQAKKYHIKYKNVAMAFAIVLLIILSIVTACSHDKNNDNKADSSSVDQNNSKADELKLNKNYKYISVSNSTDLSKGLLVLVNEKNTFKADRAENLDGVYNYMFDENQNQICLASGTGVQGNKQLLSSFNTMMKAFYSEKNIDDVVIANIYSGESSDSEDEVNNADSPEHKTGYAIDLNIYNAENGSYPIFKSEGDYSWIGENCWKFGFVQRYTADKASVTGVDEKTNHYRYVGQLNAEIMTKNNLCLEEYTEYLKKYSFEKPLEFNSDNGGEYRLYYVSAGKGKNVNLPIPLNDTGKEYKYGYSGNNVDGYVVWVKVSEDVDESREVDRSSDDSEVENSLADSKTDSVTSNSSSSVDEISKRSSE